MPWWFWVVVGAGVALVVAGLISAPRVYIDPSDTVVRDLAIILTATPGLRARFFADPTKEIGRQLPARKYWEYDLHTKPWRVIGSWRELRKTRAVIAQKVVRRIAADITGGKLSSSINTDAVFAEFFAPIVQVSQRSFSTVFLLSWGAFLAGLVLIGSGIYIAVASPGDSNSTVVGSVFGGVGAIGALGSVYAIAKQGIREATIDHARLRMVLTAFATQLGQLRALAERPPDPSAKPPEMDDVARLNDAIGLSMAGAVNLVPSLLIPKDAVEQQAQTERKRSGLFRRHA
jgi:hypothetical protein